MHRSKSNRKPLNSSRSRTSRFQNKQSPTAGRQRSQQQPATKPKNIVDRPQDVPPASFTEDNIFGLVHPSIQAALKAKGYEEPTPIQEKAIKPQLDKRDLVGCSQTGTGKTAAFVLPLLQKLTQQTGTRDLRFPKALILAPTRELAKQIEDSIADYAKQLNVRKTVIYGGVGQQPQVTAMRRGVDILIATPGRLLDLMRQRVVDLTRIETLIVDEADRMLDMGFLPDIKRILEPIPKSRQTVLFSATFPPEIRKLIESITKDPVRVNIAPEQPAVDRIRQRVVFTNGGNKDKLLAQLLTDGTVERAIVFTKMKHAANRIVKKLDQQGIVATAIHGNKSQSAREKSLHSFRRGVTPILVATDIAARGLDIKAVSLVINYDLPTQAENYIHRIGRTARAGADGEAVSFCTDKERPQLQSIENLLRTKISKHPATEHSPTPESRPKARSNQRSNAAPKRRPFRPRRRRAMANK